MVPLPIDSHLPQITDAVRNHRALVLVAEPGAGKTTRVPPALLRANLLTAEHPNLVMLQPRRVAARASAERIAEENGWELGREVGYHVRFDRRIGPQTRLRVLTEGILTRQMLDDPFLEGVGAVILDEFHERSLHTDVTAALLREVRQTVREDLILVVMSATLDAEPVAAFLGGAPVVRVPGRTFPVSVSFVTPLGDRLPEQAAAAVRNAVEEPFTSGMGGSPVSFSHQEHGRAADATKDDLLVFLPGAEEIRRTMQRLEPIAEQHGLLLLPLHGSLPFDEQQRALRPAKQRKVILATNIAETSLTIDGVSTVIDSGYARVAGFDPRRGLDKLELARISKASATQRAGRAGRTGPGRCIRLWSEREDRQLAAFEEPEVRRVDLCGTVLALHAWGKPDPRQFGWYEAPDERMLASAERLLFMLGALTSETAGQITPLGRRMMELPVHPRLARLLIEAAAHDLLDEGATVAALLSEKDVVARAAPTGPGAPRAPKERGDSDLTLRLALLAEAERDRFHHGLRDRGIDPAAARQVAKTRDELLRAARRLWRGDGAKDSVQRSEDNVERSTSNPRRSTGAPDRKLDVERCALDVERAPSFVERSPLLLRLPLLAYPDRVCRRRGGDPATATMVGGGGVRVAAESVVWDAEFFLALDARHDERSQTREAMVRVGSAIDPAWLGEYFPDSVRRERGAAYDEQRQRVVGRSAVYYRDLLVSEHASSEVPPEDAAAALRAALAPRAAEILAGDEDLAGTLKRLALLEHALPRHLWPKHGRAGASFTDEELVGEACAGATTLEQVKRNLRHVLDAKLSYDERRLLDEHAPESLEVPTGNRIKLDWSPAGIEPLRGPVLAVRLQEVFGWTDTPRLLGGRAPVVLHLLGPNYRPVQVTEDLRNFWATTYFQVRKDLRARYPKHSWPDDPLTAKPEARGGRRRT
jgi:ATP-dependent helicase HrpB